MCFFMEDLTLTPVAPFVCLFDQLDRALSTLQVQDMKSVEHEDDEFNDDFSVDPLADPRLDKMDLFNTVDLKDRDVIMNAQSSFNVADVDFPKPDFSGSDVDAAATSSSDSGSGE